MKAPDIVANCVSRPCSRVSRVILRQDAVFLFTIAAVGSQYWRVRTLIRRAAVKRKSAHGLYAWRARDVWEPRAG